MRRFLWAAAVVAAAAALPLGAQANTCNLVSQAGNYTVVGAEPNRVINAQGPLLVRCANGEELRADSAVLYQSQNEVHLFRRVDYGDPGKSLTSDMAIYNSATGRLYATGNVVFTDKNQGSTLRGPELEYFRAMAGRPQSQATALQRPHVTVRPRGGGGDGARRRNPMEIDGDRVTSVGDRYMTATGNVVIEDNGTRSTAEEAYYDQVAGHVELRRRAQVNNEKYQLSGDFITSDLQNGSVSKVLAQANARMVSERLTVTGPQLQLFFERDLLQRMISGHQAGTAVTDSAAARSVALSKGFRLEADSIEAITPEQQVRQVNAVGKARGESWDTLGAVRVLVDTGAAAARPDTATRVLTHPPAALDEKDLLTADTIIAFFRSDSAGADSAARRGPVLAGRPATAPRDSGTVRPGTRRGTQAAGDTAKTEIERLLAIGDAHSIYRTRNDSTRPANQQKPGINYLAGDRIDLRFVAGEVDVAHVRGLKQGLYLDPAQPGDSTAADSAGAAGRTAGGARTGAAGRSRTSTGARPSTTRPASPAPATVTRGGAKPPASAPTPATTPARPLSLVPSAQPWTRGTAARSPASGASTARSTSPRPRGGL